MTSPGHPKLIFAYQASLHSLSLTRNNNSWPPRATPGPLWPPQAPMTPCTCPLSLPPTTSICLPPLTHSDPLCPLTLWPLVYIYDFPTPSGPLWSNVMQDWPDGRVWIQTLPPMTPSGPTWAWAQFYQTPGLCLWIPHSLWPNLIQWLARLACCVVWWYLLLLCCMMMIIIVVLYDGNYYCCDVWW